ncbi:hypothetical protein GF402_06935 [Candidatus Fermentibacteria bacterium]|nr:hypothetical protein [Candidatus Fermentibacteria bacterium]
MRALLLLPIVAAMAGATVFEQLAVVDFRSDSLSPSPARTEIEWFGRVAGDMWWVELEDSYLLSDSGGLVPRWNRTGNDLRFDGGVRLETITVSPDLRWVSRSESDSLLLGEAPSSLLEQKGYIRPGGSIELNLPGEVHLSGFGRTWMRDLSDEKGVEAGWSTDSFGGTLSWTSPLGVILDVDGLSYSHTADSPELDTEWSSLQVGLGTRPLSLPARTQIMASAGYRFNDGEDYLGDPLSNRVNLRLRAVQTPRPTFSYNVTLTTSFDNHHQEGWTQATTAGGVRAAVTFDRGATVPSNVVLGGMYTVSAISTARFELSSRLHVYRGLSVLLDGTFRRTPTDVPGAPAERRSATLGSGLEYRLGSYVRAWALIEHNRTELSENEAWGSMRGGLELYPGVVLL